MLLLSGQRIFLYSIFLPRVKTKNIRQLPRLLQALVLDANYKRTSAEELDTTINKRKRKNLEERGLFTTVQGPNVQLVMNSR